MTTRSTPRALLALAAVVAVVVGACSGPVLANPAAERPVVTPAPTAEPRLPDPQPVELPRDDGPHDRLTEWWYYTGHLRADDGTRLGFEYVVFRAERGGFPVSWASHLALTDETGDAFHYAQRAEIGPQADGSPRDASGEPTGFALTVTGLDVTGATPPDSTPWTMSGSLGTDRLAAAASPAEVRGDPVDGFGLDLALTPRKAPALHDTDGYIDFGVAGGSYYYSRTTMTATGSVTLGDRTLTVEGDAWFDHQWGDFISVGGGGWDWFAVNLEDGTDLTVSLVRAADGSYPLDLRHARRARRHHPPPRPGRVQRRGHRHVDEPRDRGGLPGRVDDPAARGGARHPAPATVAQQELDTRATTGVVYWEGSQVVTATRDGRPLGGEAYVELTGYLTADAP